MKRMTRKTGGSAPIDTLLSISNERLVAQAELDYYDCMARFGHQSAEAHAARQIWRRLRRSRTRTKVHPS